MNIAIDGRELCGRPTGVGRYLACLLQAWDRLPEATAHRFAVYLPADTTSAWRQALGLSSLSLDAHAVQGGHGTWWEQVCLPAALRRDRPDVLFSPAYTSPLAGRVPVVLTLHDLSFVAHPEWFPPRTRLRRRLLARLCARHARVVLTDAAFSRGEIVALLGVAASKVRVIPLGLTAVGRPPAADGQGGAPRNDLVLFVGSLFNRRHLPELIRAFAQVAVRRPGLRLEIVGENRTYPTQDLGAVAAEAGVADRTAIRSYVPDEVLASLYAGAGVFVFLSDYEGFGLTPLEALAAGVPILVGDTPVAREIYGDAAAFVRTGEVDRIAEQIDRLLCDAPARAALLAHAPAVLARYSWDRAGQETLQALVEAARA